jgi:hypothetical protein
MRVLCSLGLDAACGWRKVPAVGNTAGERTFVLPLSSLGFVGYAAEHNYGQWSRRSHSRERAQAS